MNKTKRFTFGYRLDSLARQFLTLAGAGLRPSTFAECLCKHMCLIGICAWLALDRRLWHLFQCDYENKLFAASPTLAQSYHPQGMGKFFWGGPGRFLSSGPSGQRWMMADDLNRFEV